MTEIQAIHDISHDDESLSPLTITSSADKQDHDISLHTQSQAISNLPEYFSSTLSISDTVVSLFTALVRRAQSRALGELSDYLRLPTGWDGYIGSPFSKSTIRNATVALNTVADVFVEQTAVPDGLVVGPCGDGSVTIEWDLDGDEYTLLVKPMSGEGTLYVFDSRRGTEKKHDIKIDATHTRPHLLSVLAKTSKATT